MFSRKMTCFNYGDIKQKPEQSTPAFALVFNNFLLQDLVFGSVTQNIDAIRKIADVELCIKAVDIDNTHNGARLRQQLYHSANHRPICTDTEESVGRVWHNRQIVNLLTLVEDSYNFVGIFALAVEINL